MQDSFLIIFDKITQYKEKGSFEGWLRRITINTALQKYRLKDPLDSVKEIYEHKHFDETLLERESLDVAFLLNLIQKLPDRYRLIFNLYVLDDYSHIEIAEMLKISEGTSKSNLSRARKIIREQIKIHQQQEQKE